MRPDRAFSLDDSRIGAYGGFMSQPEPEPLSVRCGRISAVFWFCVQTHPQAERWADANLRRSGYPVYLPMCTVLRHDRVLRTMSRPVEVPLWPGYLFVRLGHTDPWTPIRYSPGVVGLLGGGGLKPEAVPDGLVEALQASEAARRTIEPPGPLWRPGTPCRLGGGAFEGHAAVVVQIERETAVVALPVFGAMRRVIVGIGLLSPRDEI